MSPVFEDIFSTEKAPSTKACEFVVDQEVVNEISHIPFTILVFGMSELFVLNDTEFLHLLGTHTNTYIHTHRHTLSVTLSLLEVQSNLITFTINM